MKAKAMARTITTAKLSALHTSNSGVSIILESAKFIANVQGIASTKDIAIATNTLDRKTLKSAKTLQR